MEKEQLDTLYALGLEMDRFDESFLQRMIEKRMSECSCDVWDDYNSLLNENDDERSHLKEYLTVSYTEFFRNQYTFSALEKLIIPVLLKGKIASGQKEIRVWSAACATGQEAYSISMLFHENILSDAEGLRLRVFGTDVDPLQVMQASKAEYSRTNLNHVTLQRFTNWFVKKGHVYTLQDTIRQSVDFSEFDLLDTELAHPSASIFGGFDIVFCANILFYYTREAQKRIISKVNNSLVGSGVLIVGETERDILLNEGFVEVVPQSGIFKKK